MENKTQKEIKKMSHFRKLSPVNLQFQDLSYKISQGRKEPKLILQNVSGQFRSGQLNAILGSSGSGKTTLLNVLAGYKTAGVNGTIMVNGRPLVLKEFHKLSRYIMQQNLCQSYLTVQESMNIAADLKLNREPGQEDKVAMVISEILEILMLTGVKDTLSNKLSGGERKRLSIALELINNPPVIFLDEPTTGLDEFSSSQCISLLKALAERGRTVICSIHTPSARMFEKFDNVYVMSEGLCVYQGYGKNLITFLSDLGLSCPKHYNPADFVIEVTSGQYGDEYVERMSKKIENERNDSYCKDKELEIEEINSVVDSEEIYTTAFFNRRNECFRQFKILLYRRFLQAFRNKQYLLLKIVVSIVIGLFMGMFFFDIGNDASKPLYNSSYCLMTVMSFVYITIMPITLYLPLEIKLLQREHFNKWYGLTAYYLAMTVETFPMHIIIIFLYSGSSYMLSGQPMELHRFILIILICSLVVLVAESHGLVLSSVFNITHGIFVAPVTIIPLMLLSFYGIGEFANTMPVLIEIGTYFNYVRYGYEGFVLAIYGNERPFLECPEEEIICVLRDPKKVISFIGFHNTYIWKDFLGLVIWFFIFRITAFYLLRLRLQTNHSCKFLTRYTS